MATIFPTKGLIKYYKMVEILLSVAGIIFGGGMIGKLVMFFVKRRDEKNKETNGLLSVLIKNICKVQETINDILEKITDTNNQIRGLFQQQIDFLEKVYDNEKALSDELSALYNTPGNKDICKKCIEIHKRYPNIDIEANKAERKRVERKIISDTNEYIGVKIKEVNMFPDFSSDFLCLKKSIKRQLSYLICEYQKVYYKLRYMDQEDNIEASLYSYSAVDENLFKLLGLLEQMKNVISKYIKH